MALYAIYPSSYRSNALLPKIKGRIPPRTYSLSNRIRKLHTLLCESLIGMPVSNFVMEEQYFPYETN